MNLILIATDGSPASRDAITIGLELAAAENAAVTFVHVAPFHDPMPLGVYAPGAAAPHATSMLDYAPLVKAGAIAAARGVDATVKLLQGHPPDEIVAYADSIGADLIVIGSRGHGALGTALLGSVSHRVLAETRRPVLVVRDTTAPVEAEAEAVAVA